MECRKVTLRADAIPTLFPNVPSYLSKKTMPDRQNVIEKARATANVIPLNDEDEIDMKNFLFEKLELGMYLIHLFCAEINPFPLINVQVFRSFVLIVYNNACACI